MKLASSDSQWRLPAMAILLVGVAARIIHSLLETFCCDGYAMMRDLERSLPEYIQSMALWGFPLRIHHWIAHRLLWGHLYGFKLLPVTASVATICVCYWGLRRFWRHNPILVTAVLCLLTFNAHALYLANYTMFSYSNSLLVSTGLFFLFLRLSSKPIAARHWVWIALLCLPGAFFSILPVAVTVATGAFSVVIFRCLTSASQRNLKNIGRSILEMTPLLVFPVTYWVVYSLFPFRHLGPARRPDMNWMFLGSSQFPFSLWGALQFTYSNTLDLLRGALLPSSVFPALNWRLGKPIILLFALTFTAIILGVGLMRQKLKRSTSFTLLYVITGYAAILVGGLAGIFPFGNIRYADFLLVPLMILMGYVASVIGRQVLLRHMTIADKARWIPASISALLLTLGVYCLVFVHYRQVAEKTNGNLASLQKLAGVQAHHILVSAYSAAALEVRAPELLRRATVMSWDPNELPVNDLAALLKGHNSRERASVLVIAPTPDLFFAQHPLWASLIVGHFNHAETISGPNIWGGVYQGIPAPPLSR